jgi:hypothetical protein
MITTGIPAGPTVASATAFADLVALRLAAGG